MAKTFPMADWPGSGAIITGQHTITMKTDVSVTYPSDTQATITIKVSGKWNYIKNDGSEGGAGYWNKYSPGAGATVTCNNVNLGKKVVFGNGSALGYGSYDNGTWYSQTWTATIARTTSSQSIPWVSTYQATYDGTFVLDSYAESGTITVNAKPVSTATVTLTKGNGISSVTGAGTYTIGSSVTISATPNTGYTFSKWTDSSGQISTSSSYTFNMPSNNVSYTANATVNTYSVQYEKNAPNNRFTVNGTMSDSSHTYDTAKNLTVNAYTCDGFTFAGWNTQADGKGTSYANSASVKNLTSTNGATVKLYAQWDPNHINIYENATNGFKPYDIYIYNGSSWDQYTPFIYDGSQWVPYN